MRRPLKLPEYAYPKLGKLLDISITNVSDLTNVRQGMHVHSLGCLREHIPLPPRLEGDYRRLLTSGVQLASASVTAHTIAVASLVTLADLLFDDDLRTREWWLMPRFRTTEDVITSPIALSDTTAGAEELVKTLRKVLNGIY